jgi:aspartate/glutamate racemase
MGFMSRKSTMEVISLIKQVMKQYMEQKHLHMIIIDLEKDYDKLPKNVMWTSDKHKVPTKHIRLIKE